MDWSTEIEKAIGYHQSGCLEKAEEIYRKILQINPNRPDLLHLQGLIAYQLRDNDKSADLINQAIQNNPANPLYYCSLGDVFKVQGKLNDSIFCYRKALQLKPDLVEAYYKLGNTLADRGKSDEAVFYYQKALGLKPDYVDAHNNLGRALNALEKFDEAISCFQNAVSLEPEFAEAHFNLGITFKNQGKITRAIACYQKALQLKPTLVAAYYALGNALQDQGKFDQAIACYQKALHIKPNFPEAYYNMGNAAKDQSRLDEAIVHYQKALKLKPNFPEAYNNMGVIYKDQNTLAEAIDCYQTALKLKPSLVEAHFNMGIAVQLQGNFNAGLRFYEQALKINPEYSPARWLLLLSLPILYKTEDDICAHRKIFADNLNTLIKETKLESRQHKKMALDGLGSMTNFYLQYQGQNDLDLQKKYGRLVCKVMAANFPRWSQPKKIPPLNSSGKIRVGYVSSFMRAHTVGEFLMGWIENSNRKDFEIYCYYIHSRSDALTQEFKRKSDHFYQCHGNLEAVAERIISDNLHILVFTDIGMYAPATQLAGLRLAPIQCKGWGHPVTTGLPTIDYYLSSDLMEPENSQEHYSEKLIRLPNIALVYKKPNLPANPKSRGDLGIKKEAFVYLTSQSLFKCLPQYDFIYPAIAYEVPNAQFVFLSHKRFEITEQFKKRLANAFGAYQLNFEEFCRFLPRLNFPDFLSLNLASDVILDTFCWSGGKTTLEAISCGLPVVTCPGEFMRGRHAFAMLKMIGVTETVAKDEKDYIDIAACLGRDKDFYLKIKRSLEENQFKLYEDKTCIQALEDFFVTAVDRRKTKKITKDEYTFTVYGNEKLYHGVPFWDVVNNDRWENETFRVIRKFCREDGSYIDIGSWIGPTVLYAACIARHVYAIEPDPSALLQLKDNIALNKNLQNKITLFEGCLGDLSGKIRIGNRNSFGNSETSIRFNDQKGNIEVDSLTFDDFVRKYHIADCNLIKMDVEGAEYLIIPTMENFLRQYKPTLFVSIHKFLFKSPQENKYKQIIETLAKVYKYLYYANGDKINKTLTNESPLFDIVATDIAW